MKKLQGTNPRVDHVQDLGSVALGSRLRRLSERLLGDVGRVYKSQGLDFNPTWFPLFTLIAASSQGIVVTVAAKRLGLTHPAVSQFAKELTSAKLIAARIDESDARRRTLHLTATGGAMRERLQPVWKAVDIAARELVRDSGRDLLAAVQALEDALDRSSVEARILRQLQVAASAGSPAKSVMIVDFKPAHAAAFKRLNMNWIREHFKVEPIDREVLSHPQKHLLAAGGAILVAMQGQRAIGVCGLKRISRREFELCKMAVDRRARGQGIGARLMEAAISRARSMGARELMLESNSKLQDALRLYRKFGFVAEPLSPASKYERTDVAMRLRLS